MIEGIGTDIVEVERIEKAIQRQGDTFLNEVFTEEERAYCSKHKAAARNYAGRFAAKEALLKALGTGLRDGIRWHDINIVNDDLGKPCVLLSGKAKTLLENKRVHISISHCASYATAFAVIEIL